MSQSVIHFAERHYVVAFLAATGVCLFAAALGRTPAKAALSVILVVGVIFLGLPHGALDTAVAKQALGRFTFYSWQAFSAVYASIALLYGLAWFEWPSATLAGFLAISALHFSEDWEEIRGAWTRLAYGAAVVSLPALGHRVETAQIYSALGTCWADTFADISRTVALVAAPIAMAAALAQWRKRRTSALEFGGIVAGALALHPLLFFSCYFLLLHSPRHLFETARRTGLCTLKKLLIAVSPALLASIFGGVIFWALLPQGRSEERILRVIFIGLAALTLPHMILTAVVKRHHLLEAPSSATPAAT